MNATALENRLNELFVALGTSAAGHAMFSRHGVPLLLLPKDRSIAEATVELYRPQTLKAKAAAAVVRLLCQVGWHRHLLPSVPGESDKTGMLVCNPNHGTRIVTVRRKTDGRLEIVKAARRVNAEPLQREHAALTRQQGKAGVPEVGPLEEQCDAIWFSMPHLRDAPRHIDPVPLLRSWETDIREAAPENGLIRDLLPLLDGATRDVLAGKTVRRALVHGDFAPWNWRADNNGHLVCIDWEWAREDGFAGFDLIYRLVQQALLVKKVGKERLLDFVRCKVSRLGAEGQTYLTEAGLPLALLVSLVLAYRRSKGMDEPSHGDETHPSQSGGAAPRFIVLEGADGVGKSTVLRLLVPELVRRGGFTGYLFFHWKPVKSNLSYNTIPGDDPHDPRGKEPRNPFASLVFLAHHWLDFQLGYWRFIRPAIRAEWLVVADRYTYDVLLDPKRFRLRLPTWILRLFVRMTPRPDRALLLHANPAVIHGRKPELTTEEINAYQSALLSCMLVRDAISIDANQTPDSIINDLLHTLFPR